MIQLTRRLIKKVLNKLSLVAFVCSAGNGYGKDACEDSPRRAAKAFPVASSTKTDLISDFSNIGKCVKIFAPGTQIVSLVKGIDGIAATYSGTSMATPHVAGVMAILASQYYFTSVDDLYARTIAISTKSVIKGLDANTANSLVYNRV